MKINIIVNGRSRGLDGPQSLEEFIRASLAKGDGIIVELNGEIIHKDKRQEYPLQEGDEIELIQFIGGG